MQWVKENWNIFMRVISVKMIWPYSENTFSLNGKDSLSLRADSFPFRVHPYSEGAWCDGKQIGSTENFLSGQK